MHRHHWHLCLEFADKILLFAVLERWLLQRRDWFQFCCIILYIKPKMVAWQRPLVAGYSHYLLTTETPSITNYSVVAIVDTTPAIVILVPKLVAMATSLSTSGPPSEPKTQTASRAVQPFLYRWPQNNPILYNGTPLSQNCPFPLGDQGHI